MFCCKASPHSSPTFTSPASKAYSPIFSAPPIPERHEPFVVGVIDPRRSQYLLMITNFALESFQHGSVVAAKNLVEFEGKSREHPCDIVFCDRLPDSQEERPSFVKVPYPKMPNLGEVCRIVAMLDERFPGAARKAPTTLFGPR